MKRLNRILALLLVLALTCGLLPAALAAAPVEPAEPDATNVGINPYNFPDDNFRDYVLYFLDLDHDYSLNDAEIAAATLIDVSNADISSLKGIEFFTALQNLNCSGNQLSSLSDITNPMLQTLDCSLNPIEYCDFSNLQSLQKLNCEGCGIVFLSVGGNASLKELNVSGNELTSLDVRNNTQLENLDVGGNELVQIDVSKNLALEKLDVSGNKLISLDVSKHLALEKLVVYWNKLTSLDVSNNTQLEELHCAYNNLTSLDVSKNTKLNKLECYANSIAALNIGNCPNLVDAYKNGTRYTVSTGSGEYWAYRLKSSGYELAVDKTTEISTVHTPSDLGNYTFDFRSGPVEHPGFDISLELVFMDIQGDIGISSGGSNVSLLDLDLDGHDDVRAYSKDGKSYFYVDSHTNLRGTYKITVSEAVKDAFASSGADYYSSFTFQYPSPWNPFTDVAEGKYYYMPVIWAYYHDPPVTGGVSATQFGPNKDCTREQIVTFLWKAAGAPEPTTTVNPFVDVKSGKYYEKPVLWAVENGITSGMDATHFGVGKPCTREQAMTFLWKAAGAPEPTTTTNPFTDVKPGKWYEKAILWAVQNGITGGVSADKFGVGQTCTRAQIVTFLYKYYGSQS